MAAITCEDILKKIANKAYHPVYCLMGEEPYYIDLISDYIENNVLDENEKEFNLTVLYGKDTDVPTLISYAKRFPMMSNFQVLIVKEAQDIKKIEELLPYIENPLKSTILVLCYKYGKFDKRKAFAKAIDKHGVLYETPKLYDNQVAPWIVQYLQKKKYSIQSKATALLVESLGSSLSRIVNELDKLIINIPPGTEITAAHVEENIGISKDFNVFELTRALEQRDEFRANHIMLHLSKNEKEFPLVMIIAMIYLSFAKILLYHYTPDKSPNNIASVLSVNPFFVKDYERAARNYSPARAVKVIALLREYDLKSKGIDSSAPESGLLKELVYKILH